MAIRANGDNESGKSIPHISDVVTGPVTSGSLVVQDQMLPPNLFILPVNSPLVFPTMLAPIMVSLPRHVAMIEEAINRQRMVGLLLTREGDVTEKTKPEDLYDFGVVVKIVKRLRMPDGSVNLLVHSIKRFRSKRVLSEEPYIVVETEYQDDISEKSNELDALTRSVISHVKKLAEINPFFTEEMRLAMINAPGPGTVADLVAFALTLPKVDAQDFLETLSVKTRFEKLLVHLRREQDVADLQKKINTDVNSKLSTMQREFFLKEQLKSIKRELGFEEDGKEKSARSFRERIEAAGMPAEAKKIALEELDKFETLIETSPEYTVSRNYLETLCSLPWSKETEDRLDLANAQKVLDSEHYGLEKVKERIIEFLAVRKLKADTKGSIICLVGPPGVGKTSIGKSIAQTLGRNFFRFSLGGMRDEAEIKGHRRTYVGALPGKVLQGIRRAGSKNAVLMLDEIDKLGQSFQGDPASALLEVLDPEQNATFLDHYLDVPFDLSKVLFVTTANTTSTIPAPLLDRMEVIELPGYTIEEKEDIANRYIIPKELTASGLKPQQLRFEKAAVRQMINDYAREPGLRSLQQHVGRIARKAAAQIVKKTEKREKSGKLAKKSGSKAGQKAGQMTGQRADKKATNFIDTGPAITVRAEDLNQWLGPKRFYNEIAERITSPGVVVGLAWTSHGGDILFIEAADLPGSGQLKFTGQMGEVMTESAQIAWTYVKKKAVRDLKLDPKYFKENDLHLHIPAGAIPKDGPSAGITMASALYSLLSGRKGKHRVAMTGELSLIGKVLPVGGIKEKLLAARRAGITTLVLPKLNEKDVAEVPAFALQDLTIHYVSHVEEVFDLVLGDAHAKASETKTFETKTSETKTAATKAKSATRKGLRLVSPRSPRAQKSRKARPGSSAAKPYN
jgi:ATP-dependent Lon protease